MAVNMLSFYITMTMISYFTVIFGICIIDYIHTKYKVWFLIHSSKDSRQFNFIGTAIAVKASVSNCTDIYGMIMIICPCMYSSCKRILRM